MTTPETLTQPTEADSTFDYPEIVNEAVDAQYWGLVEEGLTSLDSTEDGKLSQLYLDPHSVISEKSDFEAIPVDEKEMENEKEVSLSHFGIVHTEGDAESELPKYPRLVAFVDRLPDGTIKINDETPIDLKQPDLIMLMARIYGSGELTRGLILKAAPAPVAK